MRRPGSDDWQFPDHLTAKPDLKRKKVCYYFFMAQLGNLQPDPVLCGLLTSPEVAPFPHPI